MKLIKNIIAIVLCLAIITFSFAGCSAKTNRVKTNTKNYSKMNFQNDSIESGIVCENQKFSLIWDDSTKQVTFKEKATGEIYGATPQEAIEPEFDKDGVQLPVNAQIKTPITVYYFDSKTLSEMNSHASVDAIGDGDVYTEKIENGIKVTYDFYNLEISVPVIYTIADDCFNITVEPSDISDDGENYVTAVSIAPFLCGVRNDSKNNSLFIPDGSGIIAEPNSINLVGNQGSMRVYGEDLTIQVHELSSYTKNVKMPVFGSIKDNNAIFAIVTSGAEQAYINWNIGAESLRYSSVYPMFRIRGYSLVRRPLNFAKADAYIKVFDDGISTTPISVSYYTLSGTDANYSGMAKLYREYLINNKELVRSENKTPSALVKVLGALEQRTFTFGIPHKTFKTLTTIEQSKQIAEYFRRNVDGDILLNLEGFGSSGLDTGKLGGNFKISGKLGSKKEISDFSKYCKENKIGLFYNFDLISFSKSGGGFKVGTDSAKLVNGQSIYQFPFDNVSRNQLNKRYTLLARNKLNLALDKAVKATEKYNINGISVSSIANTIYSDYETNETQLCGSMAKSSQELLKKANEKLTVAASSANDYAASFCDYLNDVPLTSSNYDIATYDVPFYAMVYRGYIPMSSESLNISADSDMLKLRCIEMGISPSFTMLYDYDSSIVTSNFHNFYGASYNGNKKNAVNVIGEVNKVLNRIGNAEVKDHRIISDGVRISTFSNGINIIINETDTDKTIDGKSIKAMNYVVWEE